MKRYLPVVLIVVLVALPATILGPIIWPRATLDTTPTAAQLAALITLSVGDALFLGIGVAFLIFGYPMLRRVSADSRLRAWAMYLCVGFLLVSWWPHLNMHASNGDSLSGLLFIDYTFHLPLEITGVVLALCVLSLMVERVGRESEPTAPGTPRA